MSDAHSLSSKLVPMPRTQETRDQICTLIDTTEVFSDLQWPQIRILATYLDAYQAPAGTVVFREGDPGNFACFILEGRVDIYREDAHHERKTVISLGAGKFLGETSAFDEDARSATAVVAKATILLILTREHFLRISNEEPALAINLLIKWARTLSQRLRRAGGMLIEHLHD